MNKRYYVAYGSNLNVRQMRARCPGATVLGTATLKGWTLWFKGSKTGSYLTIDEEEGGETPVAIWEVTPEDEERLDIYEGYPRFYHKEDLKLRVKGIRTGRYRMVKAFVYVMNEERPVGIPTKMYMDSCREGYEDFLFSKWVLEEAYDRSLKKALEERKVA